MAVLTKRKNVSKSKSKTSSKFNKRSSSRKQLIKSRKSGTKTRKMRGGAPKWMKAVKNKFSRSPKAVAPVPVVPKTPIATPKRETMAEFNARMGFGVTKTPAEKRAESMARAVAQAAEYKKKNMAASKSISSSIRKVLDVSGMTAKELGNHFEH